MPEGQHSIASIDCGRREVRMEDVGIDHCRGHVAVAEELLHRADVVAALRKVGGEGVAEGVAGHPSFAPVTAVPVPGRVRLSVRNAQLDRGGALRLARQGVSPQNGETSAPGGARCLRDAVQTSARRYASTFSTS